MRRRSAARREDEHKSAAALDPGALLAALLRKQHHTTADLDGCASLSRQAAEVGCVSGAQKAITDTLRDLETMSAVKLGRCMSAMLPLAVGVIPHDCQGAGVVPHEHSLVRKETCRWMPSFHGPIPTTGRICDQCNREIDGIVYWTCGLREGVPQHAEHAVGCDIDFCPACHEQLEALFKGADQVRIKWVSDELVPLIAAALWHLSDDQRAELCCMLGDDWAVESFRDLAGVVRDVANARAVHLEDVRDDGEAAASDDCFWRIMFLLQMLAEANVRFAHVPRTDEEVPRGPRVDRSFFTLVAMDKCESYAEIRRWMRTQGVMMAVDCDDGGTCRRSGVAFWRTLTSLRPPSCATASQATSSFPNRAAKRSGSLSAAPTPARTWRGTCSCCPRRSSRSRCVSASAESRPMGPE
eukprot:TRINITY_DN5615_c0_g1_i5.p1 TRINITY_DN5615_c0_g1~~TRINITY_DN5615_c0_g1_i5.p1  ORF type:complete len:412 (+),score=76.84 TRINITY_DN5615_c0_g1_i5:67-1302(+)